VIIDKKYEVESVAAGRVKFSDYVQLIKPRLSVLVVLSAVISLCYASKGNIVWIDIVMLVIGGFLTTGGANGLNQVIEKDTDKLMTRTQDRPLPSGRMSMSQALTASIGMGVIGVSILGFYFNPMAAGLGLFSILSYAFIYTPLKQKTPFAVFVGAFPGAIPPMLGWVAATNNFGMEAGIFFLIQFIWQFPHFWAIAWVLDDDYKKGGFSLLPSSGGRDKSSAFQTMLYTLILIPVSLLPVKFGMGGMALAVVSLVCGGIFFLQSVKLYRECSVKAAQRLMFGSFLYLPIVQLTLLIDKI
jgi:protoheme IX farnesyltransferase